VVIIASSIFGSVYGQEKNIEIIISKISKLLAENSTFETDKSVKWQHELLDLMKDVYTNKELQAETEKLMINFLQSDATTAAKKAIWMDFANIVTSESVPALLKLIRKQETEVIAMLIIDKADLDVSRKFKSLLPKVSERTKIGIINHFGVKKDESAVDILYKSTKDINPAVAAAAFISLGKIGTSQAAGLLMKATDELPKPYTIDVYDANLICAGELGKSSRKDLAKKIYESLIGPDNPLNVRVAALKGMFQISDDKVGFIKNRLQAFGLAHPPLPGCHAISGSYGSSSPRYDV
jgi:HEAT repeat protein